MSVLDTLAGAFAGMKKIQDHCYETAKAKGWWDKYDNLSTQMFVEVLSSKLMLTTSELSEALEEIRKNPDATAVYFTVKHPDTGEELHGSSEELRAVVGDEVPLKPEGFGVELADAVIRIFDVCGFLGIDLPHLIYTKMRYNQTRAYKHGGKTI